MARDLSSHLVLHAGAFWLPIGLAFWAPCGARHLRLMGGMASGLWFFSMLFRMLLLLLLYLITLMEPEAMKRQLTYMVRLPHLVPDSVSFMIVATFEWTPVINANDPLTKEIPLSA